MPSGLWKNWFPSPKRSAGGTTTAARPQPPADAAPLGERPLVEGPPLEALLRRLVETPEEFRAEPRIGLSGEIDVAAVAWDVLRDFGGEPLEPAALDSLRPAGRAAKQERNRLQLVLLACWLLADDWFRGRSDMAVDAGAFLEQFVPLLSKHVTADKVLSDPDRREELVRWLLWELKLRPEGESDAQAADRLQTLDSAERLRVLREAATAERRAQEIREAMARAAAQDAASRYAE